MQKHNLLCSGKVSAIDEYQMVSKPEESGDHQLKGEMVPMD